ncbi:uncharacterized protein C8Q71DRAFT_394057 [Rhodofomes roseus]|uniref:Uncharacterized protein n=1 Tax=Rhodofomes roseus TaxID=34475 RepID=A0ABQ8JZV5_9APHY|nr:uncharacterized protein C8Q71DRAFT_394057 [Rhodofomes roseus]KAH9829903.1 hypothetical protein C8Q71DRAFT_394057 [Rhodofomes roseus]
MHPSSASSQRPKKPTYVGLSTPALVTRRRTLSIHGLPLPLYLASGTRGIHQQPKSPSTIRATSEMMSVVRKRMWRAFAALLVPLARTQLEARALRDARLCLGACVRAARAQLVDARARSLCWRLLRCRSGESPVRAPPPGCILTVQRASARSTAVHVRAVCPVPSLPFQPGSPRDRSARQANAACRAMYRCDWEASYQRMRTSSHLLRAHQRSMQWRNILASEDAVHARARGMPPHPRIPC